jgi:Mg2+ and Co2+ transporter CorA
MDEEKNDWGAIFFWIGMFGLAGFVLTAMFGGG